MKKTILIIALLALVAFPVFAKKGKQITISGSTTVLPIAQATAEIFMDQNPDVNISVRGGGSSVGIASIMAGTVDIGDASRHIKAKEIAAARESGINPYENVVANDGIAMVVHRDNLVKNLTVEQIKDIYMGKISNWKDIGGPSMPIVIISRDVSSGTFEVFNSLVLSGSTQISSALMLASNNAVVSTVESTPGAIGYAGLGYITNSVNVVKVNNVMPTKITIQDKSYPIARTLHMYTNGKPKGLVKEYIDFILSPEGQKLVEEQGFISVN
ncbi:MAG: PstS family phosphate ABC transporter substrate-binding protein [Candidatus Cloacimonetes bacterium]|nr:PstS family phosphate ABC transporter substrate-binding protein [Candidatus Cloacimonadota bacterium]MCF7814040.1 PstS family phosphate ABC transporter substrate-binding protein [Candidatus Cloacimonadota bacterium]MCF7868056.1 PstS family phosphate ABC transporter substrate-binding protein [Candidatus Cloacimonadota bacterium]MCF7883479.1 PstS family phosphate ABC transporter substrate-binding protein [Candidatus Cloacimonadota bacterium]